MARSNNVTGVERISDLVAVVGVVAPDPYTDSVRSRMGSTAARMGMTRRSARSQAQAAPPAESARATCQTHEATTPKAGDPAASSACNDNERWTP